MSHILVLYGTSEGQTAKIAREIVGRQVAPCRMSEVRGAELFAPA